MNSLQSTRLVIESLNRLDIAYMLVGSFSSNAYGVARLTFDADFVIEADQKIGELRNALLPHFKMDDQASFETVTMTQKYVFHQVETDFTVEVFILSQDDHDLARFRRRQCIQRNGLATYFPTAEDVIIQKLRWGRKKDIGDVENIMKVRQEKLDYQYINHWCEKHNTQALLDEIRTAVSQSGLAG